MSPNAHRISGETRAPMELASSVLWTPLLAMAPSGDGHPVLVIPGLVQGDLSLQPLMHFLTHLHYSARPWQQGVNTGIRLNVLQTLVVQLEEIAQESGRKVSIIGWSLGGLLGRYLALERPHLVRQVVSLASPFSGPPSRSKVDWLCRVVTKKSKTFNNDFFAFIRQPLPVPSTAMYSRSDGIVEWKRCVHETMHPLQEDVEVQSSHSGMGYHPTVLLVIADRLAQAEGAWVPLKQVFGHPVFPLWEWYLACWASSFQIPYAAAA
jgi:pimeloyl-ACP methyl ester carboxylesterase